LSPILVRPVREQLEHDRIIRLLHGKFRRKFEAGMNPGVEQNMPIGTGPALLYPDLVLLSQDRGHKLQAIVEIETGESVNHLEALAQWAHFGRVRAAFHLYVPANMVDVARRLTEDNQIHVAEIWSYHVVGDEPRFTLVHRNREALPAQPRVKAAPKPAPKPAAARPEPGRGAKPAPKAKAKPAASKFKPKAKSKAAPKPKAKAGAKKKK
jgi:hypothetical protein